MKYFKNIAAPCLKTLHYAKVVNDVHCSPPLAKLTTQVHDITFTESNQPLLTTKTTILVTRFLPILCGGVNEDKCLFFK